jgi:hypothetical protein
VFTFIAVSLPYVASLAVLVKTSIEVDGHSIEGMQRIWHRSNLNIIEMMVYVIYMAWCFELVICIGHYIVMYIVAEWYFVEVVEVPVKEKVFNSGFEGRHGKFRVGGVDANYGDRPGVVVDSAAGKVLVVPVGKKGPGLGRNNAEAVTYKKKNFELSLFTWLLAAETTAIFKHIGSLALAAPIIALFRGPCLIVSIISSFTGKTSGTDPNNPMQTNHPGNQNFRGMLSLLSECLNQVFGKYTYSAIRELVLSGGHNGHNPQGLFNGFFEAATASWDMITKSGGSISLLHGAMTLYEFTCCLFITSFVGWAALIVQDKVDWFNDPADPNYIENKNASAFACIFIAFSISFSWMSTWNQTSDALLYCVAWNRKQWALGHEFDLSHDEVIKKPSTYCPQQLRYVVPAYELDPHYEHGVHAHGVGQLGTIIATMEHGALAKPGGPNLTTHMGSVFQTGTKLVG